MTFELSSKHTVSLNTGITFQLGQQVNEKHESDEAFLKSCGIIDEK
jgi:hypothetical protein